MRKVLTTSLLLIFIFIFSASCSKKEVIKDELNISKEVIEASKMRVFYPVTENLMINEYILNEITQLKTTIKENFSYNNVFIEYEYLINEKIISFIFFINIEGDKNNNRFFYKTYNFDFYDSKLLLIDKDKLQKVYLNSLNEVLQSLNVKFNFLDIQGISYIIEKQKIRFIIPEYSKNYDYYIISLKNEGYDSLDFNAVKPAKNKRVVLTFDDGPSKITPKIIYLLNKYDVTASFFVLGEKVECFPNHLQALYNNNFEIGNHSYSHLDFSKITQEQINFEINYTQQLIYETIGIYPLLFRFPYGSFKVDTLQELKFPIILWNVDSLDWNTKNKKETENNVLNNLVNNSIILFHDHSSLELEAVENVIIKLKEMNYQFVTIYELFEFQIEENIVYGKVYR